MPDLSKLNTPQYDAVTSEPGPLLVFAGAGSGKTRVLTMRIAQVLETGQAQPEEVLALTFTNKAAREMRERLGQLMGRQPQGLWIGTFHAVAARILRLHADRLGYPAGKFTIFDEDDSKALVKRALAELELSDRRLSPGALLAQISRAKSDLGPPSDRIAALVAERYQQLARESNGMDFDDLLGNVVRLFREHEEVRKQWQDRFKWVLVDEYQDTNRAQYEWLRILVEPHRNLTVVGDDDQSIYAFRGADIRNILDFQRDFPEARIVKLEQNYRSTQAILDAAHHVISRNPERAPKRLWSDAGAGLRPVLVLAETDDQEAEFVGDEILRLSQDESRPFSEFAILFRTNAQSRPYERALTERRIPYNLVGGLRFWDRREVKDVVAYLRFLANPADAVSFDRIANVPKRRISERTVQAAIGAASDGAVSLLDICGTSAQVPVRPDAQQALARFHAELAGLVAMVPSNRPSDLVQALYRQLSLGAFYDDGSAAGKFKLDNLEQLRSLARDYDALGPGKGLDRFLTDVALTSDTDEIDGGRARVTLITLHMAKGLEYPVVFLTGFEDKLLPHERAFTEGGLDEERRLAYVGITRARERLYLTSTNVRNLFGKAHNLAPSQFLYDIPAALLDLRELENHRSAGAAAHARRGAAVSA